VLGLTLLAAAVGPTTPAVLAHDPSAWGGLYRTRDGGATWFLANEGRFVTAALDLVVHPADPSRLLLATESGLLHSGNGGRDWEVDPSPLMHGAVFALATDGRGSRMMASTGTAILVSDEPLEGTWRSVAAPTGAAPARQIVAGPRAGQVYVVGWSGLFGSGDWGETWQALGEGLPDPVVTRLLALTDGSATRSRLVALAGGALWISENDGSTWERRDDGLPSQGVDTIVTDIAVAGRLWAAGADRLFRSEDNGGQWSPFGNPLTDQRTTIYGIVAAPDGQTVLLTTDRGLYRSPDGGTNWEVLADSVPVHLPARPLLSDPHDRATVYAGFSIRPYESLWQAAAERTNALQRLDLVNVGGALAFLALVAIAGGLALKRLRRYYVPAPPAVVTAPGAPPVRHPGVSSAAAPLSEAGS
jgi:photosystem II stability/assembly factor-like uncharacterized protein